jgi:hypothetical protein
MRLMKMVMTGALLGSLISCGGGGKKAPVAAKATPVTEPVATPAGGGDETPPAGEPTADTAKPDGDETEEFAVPEMKAFHDVLHPVWHDTREKKDWAGVCAAAPKLAETAAAVKLAKVPANMKDRRAQFSTLAEKMADVAEDLRDQCNPKDDKGTEEQLTKVHEAFEKLMHLMH